MKRKYIELAILIALSIVFSYIVIPAMSGSVALDSTPAYFAAMYVSPIDGGVVGFLAHIISAALKGFPLGIPIHILVASMMVLTVICFGYSYKKFGSIVAIIVATFMNGVVSLVPFIWIINIEFFYAMILPLTLASFINAVIAIIVFERVKKIKFKTN